MKTDKAIKKIEIYLNVQVEKHGHQYMFTYEDKTCRFNDSDGDAHSFHIRRTDDNSCLQSDYHAGYWLKNLTQFLHALKRPPAKYANGTLIKGKENKRATRHGINGKVGVVIDTGSYGGYNILGNGDEQVSAYPYERDIEDIA